METSGVRITHLEPNSSHLDSGFFIWYNVFMPFWVRFVTLISSIIMMFVGIHIHNRWLALTGLIALSGLFIIAITEGLEDRAKRGLPPW